MTETKEKYSIDLNLPAACVIIWLTNLLFPDKIPGWIVLLAIVAFWVGMPLAFLWLFVIRMAIRNLQ